MNETILELAKAVSGAGEAEETLLALLCAAAEQRWTARLRDGVTVEKCGTAFRCAAAFTAAADLMAGRGGGTVSRLYRRRDLRFRKREHGARRIGGGAAAGGGAADGALCGVR